MNEQDANNVADHRRTGKPDDHPEAGITTTRPQGGAAKDTAPSRPPMPEPPRFPRVTPSSSGQKSSVAPSPVKGPASSSATTNSAPVSPRNRSGDAAGLSTDTPGDIADGLVNNATRSGSPTTRHLSRAAQTATKPNVGQPAASKPMFSKPNIGQPPTGKPASAGLGGTEGSKPAFATTPRPKALDNEPAGAPAASATPAGVATVFKGDPAPEKSQKAGTTEEGEARKIFGFTVPDEAQRRRIARILLPLVIIIGGFLFFYSHEKPTPLPELAPVGTELPMEANFGGELKGDRTIRPYDSRLKRGIVPVWQFPGTMLGTTSDGQVLATAHDNVISGWSLHTGKELWTLPSTNAPAWDNWNQPSARGMLPIDGNLVNLATGEQFPIPGLENAQYCSGTANPYIFLIGSDLVGVNPAGQQIFRSPVDSRVGTASTCHGYGAVVRVMPQSATAEAATHNALTGEVMELRGLTGAAGVVDAHFAEDGYIVVRPYVKDRNNWHAYNYQSERLFGNEMPRPGRMPLMFAGNSSGSIEPYRWAMKNEFHRGYLIADGGELFAAGDANDDDPVDALQSVREDKGLVLRQSLPQKDPSHTLLVTEDHATVIVSPHDSDPLNVDSEVEQEHYVAAYDVSSGEELWNYQIGEAEQLNLSQGILWASGPSGSVTVFSPAERP